MTPDQSASDAERRLSGIIALAVDAIISTDGGFHITLFNPAAERIFGYRASDVIGQPLDLLLPESARAMHHVHLDRFEHSAVQGKEMGHRGQIWGRRSTGELFPAEASISKIRLGDELHYTAVLRDVTRQRRAEVERETLLARETEARAAAEEAERRVAFLSRAGDVLHSSLAYEETFGALLELMVPGLATYCVVDVVDESGQLRRLHARHADESRRALMQRLLAYPRMQSRYLTRQAIVDSKAELINDISDRMFTEIAEDDEHLAILRALAPTSMMIVPLRARARVLGALLFARDAREHPYTEADVSLAVDLAQRAASAVDNAQSYRTAQRAIRARDDVLGIVSHDLRNPLAVISMCVSALAASGLATGTDAREALEAIGESTRWAQRLIQDLLDVTAIEAGGLSLAVRPDDPVLLVTRAALMFEDLATQHSITLATELPEHLPTLVCDADRVLQALGNLIANAVKFTPEGGEIRLRAELAPDGLRLLVSDSGPGIPTEDIPHIFDRFWTARRNARTRGTGMGLAIVRGVMEAHGGRAWVERGASGGATFILCFPMHDAAVHSGRAATGD